MSFFLPDRMFCHRRLRRGSFWCNRPFNSQHSREHCGQGPGHGLDLPDIAFGAQTTLAFAENVR
jgi:hypothetical protein